LIEIDRESAFLTSLWSSIEVVKWRFGNDLRKERRMAALAHRTATCDFRGLSLLSIFSAPSILTLISRFRSFLAFENKRWFSLLKIWRREWIEYTLIYKGALPPPDFESWFSRIAAQQACRLLSNQQIGPVPDSAHVLLEKAQWLTARNTGNILQPSNSVLVY